MHRAIHKSQLDKITTAGLIVTLGIIYGDIGTSPLYVMRAIIAGANTAHAPFHHGWPLLYFLDAHHANHH